MPNPTGQCNVVTRIHNQAAHHRFFEFNAVERAFYYAVRLLAKLDRSCAPGKPIVAPDAIVWAVEKLKPSLVRPLRETGQTDELVGLLLHYRSLRAIAETLYIEKYLSYCEECGIPAEDGHQLTLEGALYALAEGKWECNDTAARDSISLVLHAAFERHQGDGTDRSPQQTFFCTAPL
ncbi:hypothetical protein SAMN05192563_10528 [Paraburkholderia aspalathi]|uniref:Uncharacterized protein n=2 Tax=Paraburkholderia aspalathi TaxID=1324617 RepID=A0A1I7EQV7_9BURK|nr:hypothetical protein SAMN05192563_10528 [Paraburkholderia aspalathi]